MTAIIQSYQGAWPLFFDLYQVIHDSAVLALLLLFDSVCTVLVYYSDVDFC